MEVLSSVASGMAVVSLTVQLLKSANTIKTLIRDVEGASKELQRISELLECLSALLADVRDVMERQTSLQHCPLPPQTIFDCLKSCQSSLGLLEEIARTYKRRRGGSALAIRNLKDDIRFGFKTQDITNIEARIQRDINGLNIALGTNTTNIQLTTLSVLLRYEQSNLTSRSALRIKQNLSTTPSCTPANPRNQGITSFVSSQYGISTRTRQKWILSSLRRFGIHVRESIRETSVVKGKLDKTEPTSNNVTFASYEAIWRLLGYGVHWSRAYPYGNIMPALRVFPVVNELSTYGDLIIRGTIQEVQQAFRSRDLHPFTKDEDGYTLLHVAAQYGRPDICHLLREYGVNAEFSRHTVSPFMSTLITNFRDFPSDNVQIDMLRTLLLDFETIDDLATAIVAQSISRKMLHNTVKSKEVIEWLWVHAALAFFGTELVLIRAQLVHLIVSWCDMNNIHEFNDEVHQFLIRRMDAEMVAEYLKGTYLLLPVFFQDECSVNSKWRGDIFLGLLTSLELDVGACVAKELEHWYGGGDIKRKIILEHDAMQSPILRWEWAYDPLAPGYHVVSEFNAFAGDVDVTLPVSGWPFSEYNQWGYTDKHLQHSRRFDRRINAKARKDRNHKNRASIGPERSRSKMPGSWE